MSDRNFSIWVGAGDGQKPTLVKVQPGENISHNFENCVHNIPFTQTIKTCCGSYPQHGSKCQKLSFFPLVPDTCFKCKEFQQK